MRAVILAGGLGTRLRPYTTILPKPLVPVGDRPILEHILRRLLRVRRAHGRPLRGAPRRADPGLLLAGRHAAPDDLELRCHWEEEALGTAGALRIVPDLGGTFIAMNGDILTTLDYRDLVEFHERAGAALTVATARAAACRSISG